MKQPKDKPEDTVEMLYKHAKYERNQRHYYRYLVLRSVASFFIGIILMAFLEALGFFGFLFGLALFGLGLLFAYTL